jgi:MFS family permease
VLGFTPIEAGLSFLPMTGAIIVASTVAGRLSTRLGPGRVLAVGMGVIGLGMLLFTGISADGSYLGDVLVPGVITTTGIGLAFVPTTIAAMAGVERSDAGLASGLVNTSRQVGGSLGLAILATLATQHTQDLAHGGAVTAAAVTAGFHRAFLVGGLFALVGALIAAALLVSVRPRQPAPAAPADAPSG